MHDPAGIFLGDVQKAAKNFTFYAKKEERLGRGSVRKRRRAGAPFARLHRQTASTTTKGAGVFPPCGKMGARSGPQPAGRSAKRSGRIVVAPAAPSAFFLASASKGTPSRCKQLRPEILRKRTKKRSCKQFACRTAFLLFLSKFWGATACTGKASLLMRMQGETPKAPFVVVKAV